MKRFFILLVLRTIALLPWSALQGLGTLMGKLFLRTKNRQKRDARINVRLCKPELSEAEQTRLWHAGIINFVKTYLEMSALWLWPIDRVMKLITKVSGKELMERDEGQGLIVLVPHIGAWELSGLFFAAHGPITSMYRPQKHIDDVIRQARQRNGAKLVPDDVTGVKQMLRAAKRGEMVGILPDQVTREETGSVFSPFFGQPAVTMLLASGIARRSRAKVLFAVAERLPRGQGYHLHLLPAPEGIASKDDAVAAAALNKGVEQCVALCPEQYQWTYRRFRRLPDGKPSPYQGPSI